MLLTEPVYVAHDSLDILDPDIICHHGILGMKWGIRRYQNKDGSLTKAGQKRYLKKWDKANKYKDSYSVYKFNMKRRSTLNDIMNEDEAKRLAIAEESGDNKKVQKTYHDIVGRATGEKFNINNPVHERLLSDLSSMGGAVSYDKLGGDRYNKLTRETTIKRLEKEAPKGYKLSEWSKDLSHELIYNKETPKYVLQFEPRQHDDKPSKVHDDFEKNSDKILKQSFDAAYKDIKDSLGEDYNISKEEFIKYLDKPQVRITPEWNMAEITTIDAFTDHFPTIEYDMKNKKVLRTSLDG